MAKRKKKQPAAPPEPPDAIVAWTVGAWLDLAGQIARLRQHHLADRSAHADWLQALIGHIGGNVKDQAGCHDAAAVVRVRFRRETFDWCRRNLIIPDEIKPEDPAIKATADRLRAAIAAGEIEP